MVCVSVFVVVMISLTTSNHWRNQQYPLTLSVPFYHWNTLLSTCLWILNWILLFARDKWQTVLVTVVIDECFLQIPAPCFQATKRIVWTRTGLWNEFSNKLRFHIGWICYSLWYSCVLYKLFESLNFFRESNALREIVLKWRWRERKSCCIKLIFILSHVIALWNELIENGGVENKHIQWSRSSIEPFYFWMQNTFAQNGWSFLTKYLHFHKNSKNRMCASNDVAYFFDAHWIYQILYTNFLSPVILHALQMAEPEAEYPIYRIHTNHPNIYFCLRQNWLESNLIEFCYASIVQRFRLLWI